MEDRSLRALIRKVLFSGVALSGSLMALGLGAEGLRGPGAGLLLIKTGIMVLLATPVVRETILAADCAARKDWRFFAASAAVLVLLGTGIVLGL